MREFGEWLVKQADSVDDPYSTAGTGSPATHDKHVTQGGMITIDRINDVLMSMNYGHIVDIHDSDELKTFVSLILPPELRDIIDDIHNEKWGHVRVSLIQYKSRMTAEAAALKAGK